MLSIGHILTTTGYIGIFCILFFETALPVCFFFPGDSLLFVAGFFVFTGKLSLAVVAIVASSAALLGGVAGFFLGKVIGNKLFHGRYRHIISEERRLRAQKFYMRFGTFSLIAGRFIPIVRSFLPALAGIGEMTHRRFHIANAIGAAIWPITVLVVGRYVGQHFPGFEHFVPILFTIVIVGSIVPVIGKQYAAWQQQNRQ
jgi:membrane-associated protein